MSKDSNHYLRKANYFYKMSRLNDDDEVEYFDDPEDDELYEAIELKPTKVPQNESVPKIMKAYGRYFDPVTRHY